MGKPPLRLNWGELLPAMGEATPAPELEIVAASYSSSAAAAPSTSATVDGGGGEEEEEPSPRTRPPPEEGEMAEFSDHQLQEKLKRVLEIFSSGIALNLPDKGEKLRLSLRHLQLELDRRRLAPPARKDVRRFNRLMQSRNAESSGTTKYSSLNRIMMGSGPQSSSSKHCIKSSENEADVAFGEDLGVLSRDKCKSSSDYKLKTHDEKDSTKPFSPLGRTSSRESPFRSVSSYKEKKKKRSSDDNNSDVILSSPSDIDKNHCTLSTKRKRRTEFGDLVGLKSKKVQEVVLLDEEMPSIQPSEEDTTVQPKQEDTTDEWKDAKIYYPSREHPQSVELSYADIKCLDPESYLSSPIINFYIMYLQRSLSPTSGPRGEYYFFNTYFYNKLEEALSAKEDRNSSFLKLRRWWKGINIFKKAYIFLPVHGDLHWSLVIICIPAQEDESGPIVLHLDSLEIHSSSSIFDVIDKYLKEEWNYMNQNPPVPEIPIAERTWKNLPRRIEKRKITVPQQKNEYDCGLFVLYFMKRFIAEAPERLRRKDLTMLGGRRWFRPEEASALRNRIRSLLLEEFGKAKSGNCKKELKSSENSDEDDQQCCG